MEGLTRTELRRLARQLKKQQVKYTYSNEQLQELKEQMWRTMGKEMEERFIKLFFTMPIVVGHEKYGWDNDQCLQMAQDICQEYADNLQNPTTQMIEDYCKKMTKLTGIRFER